MFVCACVCVYMCMHVCAWKGDKKIGFIKATDFLCI